jgi:hypothetical protein
MNTEARDDPYDLDNPTSPLNDIHQCWYPYLAMPDVCGLRAHGKYPLPDAVAAHFRKVDPDFSARIREAQVFDFGVAAFPYEAKEFGYAIELFHGGFIDSPYATTIYCIAGQPSRLHVIDRLPAGLMDGFEAVPCSKAYRMVTYLATERDRSVFALIGTTIFWFQQARPEEIGVNALPSRAAYEDLGIRFAGYADENIVFHLRRYATGVFLDCALALATAGVKRTVSRAPRLINEQRVRKGKPRIPTVTHIDFAAYAAARDAARTRGTHASPITHLRRGHIRRLDDGRRVWVKDCMVNGSGDCAIDRRERYEVHLPKRSRPARVRR